MKHIAIAGNVGRDAEFKTTQRGDEFASFSVAVDDGWGDNKSTLWFDVTRWGKGAEGLAKTLRKGSKVSVCGELSTRVHDGKTYLQVRADRVTIMQTPKGDDQYGRQHTDGSRSGGQPPGTNAPAYADDDSNIPF